jgi:hypothetical protein
MRPRRVRGAARPIEVIPSDRWRPMRRVGGVAWNEQHHGMPRRVRVEWPRQEDGSRLLTFDEMAEEE